MTISWILLPIELTGEGLGGPGVNPGSLLEGTDIARIHQFEASQIIRNDIVARLVELYAQQRDDGL